MESPWIRYSQDYAFPSAAFSSDQSYKNWVYSNLIQTYFIIDRENFNISYFYLGRNPNPISYIPLLSYQGIQKKALKSMNVSSIGFVRTMIDSGYYIACLLNEFYIPSRKSYQNAHFSHGVMIYGYDDEKQSIMIAGYNKTGYFNTDILSYYDFEKAFWEVERESDCCSCFKRNDKNYEIDIKIMKDLLYDFIFSKNTSESYRMVQNPLTGCIWGIEACSLIMNDTEGLLDQRYFYMLYEHIKLMKERFEKVSILCNIHNEKIKQGLTGIEKQLNILLSLCLKYNIKQEQDLYFRIKSILVNQLKEEGEILTDFYRLLCTL